MSDKPWYETTSKLGLWYVWLFSLPAVILADMAKTHQEADAELSRREARNQEVSRD